MQDEDPQEIRDAAVLNLLAPKLRKLYVLLRNKPIRGPGTTPMGSRMYGDDDSFSVTAAGEERKSRMGAPDKSRSSDGGVSRRTAWLFKWKPPSGAGRV
ncbi:hypothetical protein Zmor_021542 [Zophobas morio]|uniref:Uncharacterized protein n=1 Tax=Zophobas morio TaxID=2755281 RepID=A0AA38MBJ4_9CUCU|nr:hypothetical protein Zmor_021542 [Zophobas morio]